MRDVAFFAAGGIVLVGAWFLVVRWVGSKQPLWYYYIYDAGLTQAQTEPVAQIAKAFTRNIRGRVCLFFHCRICKSIVPIHFLLVSRKALFAGYIVEVF